MTCKVDGQTLPAATALEKLREQVTKTSDDIRAWFQLGKILAYTNRPKAAVQALLKAVQLMPNAIDIKLALANAHVLDDENEEAFKLMSDVY